MQLAGILELGFTGVAELNVSNGASVSVGESATINSQSMLTIGSSSSFSTGAGLVNSGTIIFSPGSSDLFGDVTVPPSGRIEIPQFRVVNFNDDLNHNGNEILFNFSTANIFGHWTGEGPFNGFELANFESAVNPGNPIGSVDFGGRVRIGSNSIANFEIAGDVAGIEYDQMIIDENFEIEGSLNIQLVDGFQPFGGQQFSIIEVGGARSGTFVSIPEGHFVATMGNVDLQISYVGGDGNDIVLTAISTGVILGDVNLDGSVNLLDVAPFVALISNGQFQDEADINGDGTVNLLDVAPFVGLLSGG